MLYSLADVNQRFDRLALNSLVIHHLNFVTKHDDIHHSSVEIDILSRICSKILPRINEKIIKLTLESHSMERVINAVDYPQLRSLSLVNYQPKILLRHLSDKTMSHLLTNQITHMIIEINNENVTIPTRHEADIFAIILLICKRLSDLTFLLTSSEEYLTILLLNILYGNSFSSNLTKLTINVNSFDDCLYLLNGCLESLSTFIIRIKKITRSLSEIDNTVSINVIIKYK
ncbi:unnamed protein product [Rotaria sp. Silwood1]|nr:unnamed protein product [Rotaria sp. Silwood1]